jgi:hypothetical protein
MRDLEDLGLVRRASSHAPYELVFPDETRDLLRAGSQLGRLAHATQAAALELDVKTLDRPSTGPASRRGAK